MNAELYTTNEKFETPTQTHTPPRKPKTVKPIAVRLYVFCTLIMVSALLTSAISLFLTGLALGALAGAWAWYKNQSYKKETIQYHEQVEWEWLTSESFQRMQNFLMLNGINAETAYTVTNDLGAETLITGGFSQADGFYPLQTIEGVSHIAQVRVTTELTKKNKLKVTTKILQHI